MDSCLNCQGAILEPNKAYGYAGKICYCPVDSKYNVQRPASKELSPFKTNLFSHNKCQYELEALRQQRDRLVELLREAKDILEYPTDGWEETIGQAIAKLKESGIE